MITLCWYGTTLYSEPVKISKSLDFVSTGGWEDFLSKDALGHFDHHFSFFCNIFPFSWNILWPWSASGSQHCTCTWDFQVWEPALGLATSQNQFRRLCQLQRIAEKDLCKSPNNVAITTTKMRNPLKNWQNCEGCSLFTQFNQIVPICAYGI